jgi:glycosyltransferase involved in cell wall biosynthesis
MNSSRTIEGCLTSILAQEPGEIVAIDGLSTDGTIKILRKYGATVVTECGHSLGLARQLGVLCAKRDYVMFVDSDVRLGPSCITKLKSDMEAYGWAGIHAQMFSWENQTYWQKSEDVHCSLDFNFVGQTRPYIGTIGALFKREALLKFPFDPYFVEAAEDMDVCRRLKEHGYSVGISSAYIFHYHRRDFAAFARQRFRNGRGLARLGLKYGEIGIFFGPLRAATSRIMRSIATGRIKLVPFWFASGVIHFSGVIFGLHKAHGQLVHNYDR